MSDDVGLTSCCLIIFLGFALSSKLVQSFNAFSIQTSCQFTTLFKPYQNTSIITTIFSQFYRITVLALIPPSPDFFSSLPSFPFLPNFLSSCLLLYSSFSLFLIAAENKISHCALCLSWRQEALELDIQDSPFQKGWAG